MWEPLSGGRNHSCLIVPPLQRASPGAAGAPAEVDPEIDSGGYRVPGGERAGSPASCPPQDWPIVTQVTG